MSKGKSEDKTIQCQKGNQNTRQYNVKRVIRRQDNTMSKG
jgi:hypothetical protein